MTSFIGYINNTVIKLQIYCISHMNIDKQIINIIPKWIHVFDKTHFQMNVSSETIIYNPVFDLRISSDKMLNIQFRQKSMMKVYCAEMKVRLLMITMQWFKYLFQQLYSKMCLLLLNICLHIALLKICREIKILISTHKAFPGYSISMSRE
jgi:hypothetical protein